jgi:hypothetical protein
MSHRSILGVTVIRQVEPVTIYISDGAKVVGWFGPSDYIGPEVFSSVRIILNKITCV